MDGWAKGNENKNENAVFAAKTPFVDSLYKNYTNAELITHGESVGLPDGQMGNSEVGHLNIGAGRVVPQELMRITNAFIDNSFSENAVWQDLINDTLREGTSLHLAGLLSDGGVHSHINHLFELIKLAEESGIENIYIHAFTDGRDTDPKSGLSYLRQLQTFLKGKKTKLATLCGRYYAMDRDNRWERVKIAYDALVHGKGIQANDAEAAIQEAYQKDETDEFLKPIIITENNKEVAKINSGDSVVFFNFRTDRCRQISRALFLEDFEEQGMKKLDLNFVTMTPYDKTFTNVKVFFDNTSLKNTLGEVLEKSHKTQLRAAETEKYPHVTFFFSGGKEKVFKGEERLFIPSPKVATYDLQPEMSAKPLTVDVIKLMRYKTPDFICLNYANPDMVAHTGVFEAAVSAVETVDDCVQQVIHEALKQKYAVILTSDHGNADMMKNEDGSPNTAHTMNPVPIFFISDNSNYKLKSGKLGDIAPTILYCMGIEPPEEMTGDVLLTSAK